jgi:hypothetical protein
VKKILFTLMILFAVRASAQTDAFNGYCTQGSYAATTSGLNSSNLFQSLIPQCTVTVYNTGTTNLATIFHDAVGTPLTNPFRASTKAQWLFFAANNQGYDVVMSGGIPPLTFFIPVTLTDLKIGNGGGGGSGVTNFTAGNLPPLFTTTVTTPSTTPNLSFSLSQAAAQSFFGNPNGTTGNPLFFLYSCTGLLTCSYDNPSNTLTLNVPNSSSLTVTTTDPIKVNGTNGPVSNGTANISCPTCGNASDLLRMNPGEDATHVFVPFGHCDFTTTNDSLVQHPQSGCDAFGGYVAFFAGGLFNHNSSVTMVWSNPALPSWLPAGNVVTIKLVSYSSGFGAGPSSGCAGTGSCGTWTYPPFASQNLTAVTGVTGATLSGVTASAQTSVSVYVAGDPFNITTAMSVAQLGLLVEYSGVTNPNPSTALNINWPLQYDHANNSLGVNELYPYSLAPILTAYLPSHPYQGKIFWTSDNTQTTPGAACTGSGTAGTDYALCVGNITGYTLLTDLGASGFGVSQVTNSDGSLIFSPTTGHVVGSINPNNSNTWTSTQIFQNSLVLSGTHSPLTVRGSDGSSGQCFLAQGAGNTPAWIDCPGGSFSTLSGGTNTTAAMVVGTGASLTATGTGSIQATNIAGTLSAGTNVTITGAGTIASPYVINSTGGGGGSSVWSSLTNPTGNLALTMAANTSTWTFNAATGSSDMMKITDTASNTGTGTLFHVTTASGSSEQPWCADANGVGWCISSTGTLQGIGTSASHGAVIPEGTPISGVALKDVLTADLTTHQLLKNTNNTGALVIPGTSTTAATPGNCATYAANGYDLVQAPCGAGGSTIVASAEVVAFSATPTFSTAFNVSRIVLTGNVTSFTLGAGSDGQDKTLCFKQGAGSYTVVPPANVHGFFTIGTINADWNCQTFVYDNTDSRWLSATPGTINE